MCNPFTLAPLCSPRPVGVAWVAQIAPGAVRIAVDAPAFVVPLALLASLALFLQICGFELLNVGILFKGEAVGGNVEEQPRVVRRCVMCLVDGRLDLGALQGHRRDGAGDAAPSGSGHSSCSWVSGSW